MLIWIRMWRLLASFAQHANPYKNALLGGSIAFLVAFASAFVADVVYRMADPWSNPAMWFSLVAAAVLLPSWILSTNRLKAFNETMFLKSRFGAPTVGIFTVSGKDETQIRSIMRGSSVTPSDWIQILTKRELTATLTESLNPEFRVMINPFGERYIEYDIANMGTLKQIKSFVEQGGVFVSVGGLAFFYMFNPQSNIEGLTGPMFEFLMGGADSNFRYNGVTGTYQPTIVLEPNVHADASSLVDTWLFRNLGLRTTTSNDQTRSIRSAHTRFSDLISNGETVQEFRAAVRCESTETTMIPILASSFQYEPTGRMHESYPIAAVRYGLGYFIICGMVIKYHAHADLIARVIQRLCSIIAREGMIRSDSHSSPV